MIVNTSFGGRKSWRNASCILAALLAAVLCWSCATPYGRVSGRGGYTETQLGENTFQVSFHGNGYTNQQVVIDYALLRSAEVTQENGFMYFVIGQGTTFYDRKFGTPATFPSNTNLIICYKDKPPGFSYDAAFVKRSMRAKYGIAE